MRIYEIVNNDLIVYHGSQSSFDKFDLNYSGNGHDLNGPGIYFTTSKYDAITYGNYLITAKLKLRKVITPKTKTSISVIKKLIDMSPEKDDVLTNFAENPTKAFNNAVNQIIIPNNAKESYERVWYDFYRDENKLYCENMTKLGYDAVKMEIVGGYHYIVLNLNAIEIVDKHKLSTTEIQNITDEHYKK